MDWRDWVVNERFTTDKYWLDIANGRSNMGGFFNIKILKKEGQSMMQDFLNYLAELQNDMAQIEAKDINSVVDKRVADFREMAIEEETAKKTNEIADKQAEIDAINRIIERKAAEAAKAAENAANETENIEGV